MTSVVQSPLQVDAARVTFNQLIDVDDNELGSGFMVDGEFPVGTGAFADNWVDMVMAFTVGNAMPWAIQYQPTNILTAVEIPQSGSVG